MATSGELESLVDPDKARRAVIQLCAILGSSEDWNSDTFDPIDMVLKWAIDGLGLPSFGDQDDDALAYWRQAREV